MSPFADDREIFNKYDFYQKQNKMTGRKGLAIFYLDRRHFLVFVGSFFFNLTRIGVIFLSNIFAF